MGKSGNIGWGISNYFGLPNRKKKLLTKEFLTDFRDELIRLDREDNAKCGNIREMDYEREDYTTFCGQIEGSRLFYKALKNACKKHNLTKAIYEYAKKMEWYDSDYFDDDLVLEMVHKGVIEYDAGYLKELMESEDYDEEDDDTYKYKLIEKYKGYNVVEYDKWLGDKESLEEIYKNKKNVEIIWLD
ncbi:hypothetical protein ACOT7R_08700 [Clostridium perfringens]|uniref:hypothetical protein n=1 Tax=Clostridium perfringens TaxID=1502 RepID=UPI003BA8522B